MIDLFEGLERVEYERPNPCARARNVRQLCGSTTFTESFARVSVMPEAGDRGGESASVSIVFETFEQPFEQISIEREMLSDHPDRPRYHSQVCAKHASSVGFVIRGGWEISALADALERAAIALRETVK